MPPDGEPQVLTAEEAAALRAELETVKAEAARYRQQAFDSESMASRMAAQAQSAQSGVRSAQLNQLIAQQGAADNTIASIDGELRGLKTQLAALNAEGKFEEAADVQVMIGDAAARRREAMQAKDQFQAQRTRLEAAPSNPVDQFIAQHRDELSSEDISWIKKNPLIAENPGFRNRVTLAHNEAIQRGLIQHSPEYYDLIERRAYQRPDPQPHPVQPQPAPTGYDGGNPNSDAGQYEEEPPSQEEQPDVNRAPNGPAFNRAPDNPQPRAAGDGAMRNAIAGSPTRRTAAQSGRVVRAALTPDEWETALSSAHHFAPPDVLQGGEPAIGLWWQELKNSPAYRRMKENSFGSIG